MTQSPPTPEKSNVFTTMEDDIRAVARTDEEAARIRAVLETARQESMEKRIRHRKPVPGLLARHAALLRIYWVYGVHWKKPFYPFRLARNILMGKLYNLLGKERYVLRGIEFAVTFRCNFRCNHCLCAHIDQTHERKEMSPEDYARVVKEAMKLGATTFGLEGGEPFVFPRWREVIKACQPHYNHIIISTNGYLFDEEKAKVCAELGVDTINFSLDSGVPELHDTFRRQRGSFERVKRGVALCKQYGIKPLINTVVHKGNIYTQAFLDLLDYADAEKVLVNTLLAKGVGSFKDKDAVLDPEDLEKLAEILKPYRYVSRHLAYNYGRQFGCPGTKEMINMTPYGDVMNCANMHIYMGNVMEEPLEKARGRALEKSPFRFYNPCFLADDPDFMNIYYPLIDAKKHVTLDEFMEAVTAYEQKHGKTLYRKAHESGKLHTR